MVDAAYDPHSMREKTLLAQEIALSLPRGYRPSVRLPCCAMVFFFDFFGGKIFGPESLNFCPRIIKFRDPESVNFGTQNH